MSSAIDHIIEKALHKRAADRYQSAAEMMVALRAFARESAAPSRSAAQGSPAAGPPLARESKAKRGRKAVDSVAVFPFTNVNQQDDLEYLSDGLTDSLINSLSLVPKLRVLARSTVFRYKTSGSIRLRSVWNWECVRC